MVVEMLKGIDTGTDDMHPITMHSNQSLVRDFSISFTTGLTPDSWQHYRLLHPGVNRVRELREVTS